MRIPRSDSSLVGRVYHSQGRVHTVHTADYLCKTFVSSSYFFAPAIKGVELKASHYLDPSQCVQTTYIWLCSFDSLSDIHSGVEKRICWSDSLPKRTKRQVSSFDNQGYINEMLNRSLLPKGSDYPSKDIDQGFDVLEQQYHDLRSKIAVLNDKTEKELMKILSHQNHNWGMNVVNMVWAGVLTIVVN
jgi:hypothetical protein